MDSKITSSFIPDKALQKGGGGRVVEASGIGDLLLLLSIIVLAVALALSAGVFLYDRYLDTSVVRKEDQLAKARASFEPALIQELLRLDARLKAGADILARHLAPSEVFTLLQDLTLKSVAYKSMSYVVGDDGIIRISMIGVAQSVNGVALQSSVFGDHPAIISPIFSDLDIAAGGVEFNVGAVLDPLALQYALITQKRAQTTTQQPATITPDPDPFGSASSTATSTSQ